MLSPLVERVASHPKITVMTGSEVVGVSGYVGNFQIQVRRQGEEELAQVPAGAIIVATGYDVFDPHNRPELGYGQYPEVVTTLEFERMAASGQFASQRAPTLAGRLHPVRGLARPPAEEELLLARLLHGHRPPGQG